MGYRSRVTVVFYTRNDQTVPPAAIKLWFDENYPHKMARDEWGAQIDYDPEHGWVMATYEDVKWYEGYVHPTEVRTAIEQFCDTFDANGDDTVAFEMVRVGENIEDIEEQRSDYSDYRLGVSREIVFA